MRSVVPRLITLDVTGTLLKPNVAHRYSEAALEHGLPKLDPKITMDSFRRSYKRLQHEHPIFGRHSGLGWRNWWRLLVHDVITDQCPSASPDKLNKIADKLIECYSTNCGWSYVPGALELVQNLKCHSDLSLGVISNFDERMESLLTSMKLRHYFNFVITAYEIGCEKPDPAIFQEALRLASHSQGTPIRPSEALHVGDSVEADYLGAQAVGWDALILVHQNHKIPPEMPSILPDCCDEKHVITSLHHLRKHLDSLMKQTYGSNIS
ncbi:hypothetical protein QAD02_023741 [Eretmocerus hayati]|uniref:Uncharacterized protein n=1 Tax=Eretmocerus hayati TaxID=131215 RepID=A0ACC2PYD1_9HYME|nr:hypothetical protein QAD02_023741 [Eretmocerus hayati]